METRKFLDVGGTRTADRSRRGDKVTEEDNAMQGDAARTRVIGWRRNSFLWHVPVRRRRRERESVTVDKRESQQRRAT